jgi:hypothetical protein
MKVCEILAILESPLKKTDSTLRLTIDLTQIPFQGVMWNLSHTGNSVIYKAAISTRCNRAISTMSGESNALMSCDRSINAKIDNKGYKKHGTS